MRAPSQPRPAGCRQRSPLAAEHTRAQFDQPVERASVGFPAMPKFHPPDSVLLKPFVAAATRGRPKSMFPNARLETFGRRRKAVRLMAFGAGSGITGITP